MLFGRGELTRGCLDALRDATGPMTSRQVAQAILSLSGDRKLITQHTRMVSKSRQWRHSREVVATHPILCRKRPEMASRAGTPTLILFSLMRSGPGGSI